MPRRPASSKAQIVSGKSAPGSFDFNFWKKVYFAAAIAVPIAYVLVTHQVWEDCLITLRHSRNFVDGNGLVFNIGRKVQGFTSCLNVMLLALFYAITGRSTDLAIDFYRVVCLAAYVLGGWVMLRLMLRNSNSDRYAPLIFILLYVTEAKMVAYTMNGQESAFMVAFMAIGFYAAYEGPAKNWKFLALAFTGLLYTRPDAPMYIVLLAAAGLIFPAEDRRVSLRALIKAAVIAAVLFSPWFISMWIYYGWPIPNTVTAKSGFNPGFILSPFGTIRMMLSRWPDGSQIIFEPIDSSLGGWPRTAINSYDLICWVICNCYWMIPSKDRLGRLASLIFTLSSLYLALVASVGTVAAWYVAPTSLFAVFTLARATYELVQRIPRLQESAQIARLIQGVVVAMSALIMIGQTYEMHFQQKLVEDGSRTKIGLYLHDVVKPGQKIYLEPLGYIGYYSDRYIWDWPGLVAPEVVHLHKDLRQDQISALAEIMPEWMVLRTGELQAASAYSQIAKNYGVVRMFNVRPQIDSVGYIPGVNFLQNDGTFFILQRLDVQPASSTSDSPYGEPYSTGTHL